MPKTKQQIDNETTALHKQYKELNDELKKLRGYVKTVWKKTVLCEAARDGDPEERQEAEDALNGAEYLAKRKATQIMVKYGDQLEKQLEGFFKGPGGEDEESVSKWISENYIAARLCTSSDFMKQNTLGFGPPGDWDSSMRNAAVIAKLFFSRHAPEAMTWGIDKPLEGSDRDYKNYIKTDKEAPGTEKNNAGSNLLSDAKWMIKRAVAKAHPDNEPDYYHEDKKTLDDFETRLKNAKTGWDSGEYKSIINMVKLLNSEEKVRNTEEMDLNGKENHAMKLFTIKDQIDKYISHKAKDGVKHNVYKKLAVVEELNRFVSERILELDPDSFYMGSKHCSTYEVKSDEKNITEMNDITPEQVKQKVADAGKRGIDASEKECMNVHNCMRRIIDKARHTWGVSGEEINKLENMSSEFLENPSPNPAIQKSAGAVHVL